jgi:endonuclease YncB( thermonuclease family)
MTPRLSPAQREHVEWLRSIGVTIERIRRGRGSHLVAYLRLPDGRERVAVMQLAEGDWRAPRNFRAAILRELRQNVRPTG